MNKIETIYQYCDRFSSTEKFERAIRLLSPENKAIIDKTNLIEVSFIDTESNLSFAWALFYKSQCIKKEFNLVPFSQAGARYSDKLIDLPSELKDSFMRLLNSYFSKPRHFKSKNSISKYKQNIDFIFDIYLLSDGVKSVDLSKTVGVQENHCNHDRKIPKYLEDRFKTIEEVPFHRIKITHDDIDEALNKLSDFYYHTLSVWFFPEREPKNKQSFEGAHKLKHSDNLKSSKYLKSLRNKEHALLSLFNNILNVQNQRNKTL